MPPGIGMRDVYAGYMSMGAENNSLAQTSSLTAYKKGQIDPEKTMANISQADYNNYLKNIRPRELELLEKAKTDTTIIDQAVKDRDESQQLMQGISDRNATRYGAALTPAQIHEQERTLARGTAVGGADAVNNARVAQKDSNRALMNDLTNIGQGLNKSSLSSLNNAAANAAQRESAYKNAKAQARASNTSALAGLAVGAIVLGL